MVATGLLGILTLVIMQVMKSQASLAVKSAVDLDMSMLKNEIQMTLNNPAHCTANFANITTAGLYPAAIYLCKPAPVYGCNNVFDKVISQKLSPGGPNNKYSDRVKVLALEAQVDNPSVMGSAKVLANARLLVNVKKTYINGIVKTEVFTFNTTVILDSTSTIIGCPKFTGSTIPYQ